MSAIKKILVLILLNIAFVQLAVSQNGGFAGNANKVGLNPKSMAMSNAMTANTSENVYAHYNPALASIKRDYTQLHLGVSSLRFDRVHQTVGASFQLPPNAGLSVELIRSGVNDIDGRTASGYPTGEFDTSEYQLLGAFGMRFSEQLYAGVGFKLNYSKLHEQMDASTGVGLDLGLIYKLNSNINLGFALQDLLAEYSFNSAELYGLTQSRNVINKFPTRVKWGLSYEEADFNISTDFEVQILESEVQKTESIINNGIPQFLESTSTVKNNLKQFRIGGEWLAHERFTLRGGYNLPDLGQISSWGASTGFSIYLPFDKFRPTIDYAFVLEPNRIANIHVFALSLQL